MSDLNIIVVTGRLVRDPLFKSNGSKLCLFTVACNRRYRDKSNEQQEETAFIDCKCFGNWTSALEGRAKGDAVMVCGRLRTETWEKDGIKNSKLVLVCDSVRFIGGESRPETSSETSSQGRRDLPPNGKADDDVPF